jgi:hypothetical protein
MIAGEPRCVHWSSRVGRASISIESSYSPLACGRVRPLSGGAVLLWWYSCGSANQWMSWAPLKLVSGVSPKVTHEVLPVVSNVSLVEIVPGKVGTIDALWKW